VQPGWVLSCELTVRALPRRLLLLRHRQKLAGAVLLLLRPAVLLQLQALGALPAPGLLPR
jgi:hypothetical protein